MADLKYRWRSTFADTTDDYVCIDGKLVAGRLFRNRTYNAAEWQWVVNGVMRYGQACAGGWRDGTAREIAAVLEAEYDRVLSISDGLQLFPRDEVAHYLDRGLALPPSVAWRKARILERRSVEEADAIRDAASQCRPRAA